MTDANAVQREGSADLDAANAAYRRFSRGKRPGPVAVARLQDTVTGLKATRERLADLDAPAPASGLRQRLLTVFDRNVDLAEEAALLAVYSPAASRTMAALPRLGAALRRGLASTDAAGQERALARYGRRLAGLERRMRALSPPPVLVSSHRSQLLRLSDARSLTARLRAAVGASDAAEVSRLLLRFRDVYASSGLDRQVQRAAVRAYRERLLAVNRAVAEVQREQQRLGRSLK